MEIKLNRILSKQGLVLGIMVIGLAATSKGYSQDVDGSKFKTGKFTIANSFVKNYLIVRNDTIQTESDDNETYTFRIEWTSNSSYNLIPTKETAGKMPDLPPNAILTVKIIEVKDNSYIQTSSSNFSDFVQTSEVIKIQ